MFSRLLSRLRHEQAVANEMFMVCPHCHQWGEFGRCGFCGFDAGDPQAVTRLRAAHASARARAARLLAADLRPFRQHVPLSCRRFRRLSQERRQVDRARRRGRRPGRHGVVDLPGDPGVGYGDPARQPRPDLSATPRRLRDGLALPPLWRDRRPGQQPGHRRSQQQPQQDPAAHGSPRAAGHRRHPPLWRLCRPRGHRYPDGRQPCRRPAPRLQLRPKTAASS